MKLIYRRKGFVCHGIGFASATGGMTRPRQRKCSGLFYKQAHDYCVFVIRAFLLESSKFDQIHAYRCMLGFWE